MNIMKCLANCRSREIIVIVSLILLTMTFSAFGGGEQEKSKTGSEKIVLKVNTYQNPYYKDILEAYEAKHPNVAIEKKLSASIDTGAMNALLQSNDPPDVMLANSGPGRVGPLAKAGLLLDLKEYYDSRGWRDKMLPYVMNALQNFGYGYYEMVNSLDVFQVYYRADFFKEMGLSKPNSFQELEKLMENIKSAKKDTVPFIMGVRNNVQGGWVMGNLFQSATDYEFMTELIYGDASFTNPNIIKAAKILGQWIDKGYVNKDAIALLQDEARTLFGQGKGAIVIGGQGYANQLIDDKMLTLDQINGFIMPSMNRDGRSIPTAGLAHSWVIPKGIKSDKKEEALKFLDFIASHDYIRVLNKVNGWRAGVPAIKITEDVELPKLVQDAVTALEGGSGYNPSVFLLSGIKTVYYESIQAIFSGSKSPEEAMAAIQKAKEEQ